MSDHPADDANSDALSPTTRTIVSFLLFLHLFALGVVVMSRASRAPLEWRLREVPLVLPYTQLLAMDWPYTHNLTGIIHAGAPDHDVRLETELRLPDGTTETILWPDRSLSPGDRWRRYATLVHEGAQLADGTTIEDRIPAAVARRLVAERQATGGEIRYRGRSLPEQMFQDIPAEYAAIGRPWKILVSGGKVTLFKVESAADTAPSAAPQPDAPPSVPK